MKCLHIDLTGPFTEGATYQENLLPIEQAKLGHEVVMWASCYSWIDGKKTYVGSGRKKIIGDVVLERLEYRHVINAFVTDKIRAVDKIYDKLVEEDPDWIMVHDGQTSIVHDVCRYKKDHENVVLIADSHTDPLNSARNWFSKNILHILIYKRYMRELYDNVKVLYCISPEVREYISQLSGLNKDKMVLLPLGGNVVNDTDYSTFRSNKRNELGINTSTINIIHTGKLVKEKHTLDLLELFRRNKSDRLHLTLIGMAEGEILNSIKNAAAMDERISWLGWKSGEELTQYLCAGDVYVLPRDVSATVQNSMCCRCGIIVYPYEIYKVMKQNVICYAKNVEELEENISRLIADIKLLDIIRHEAYNYAKEKLDYASQARTVTELLL